MKDIDPAAFRLERATVGEYDAQADNPGRGLWHMPGLTDPEDEWWETVLFDERDPDDPDRPRIASTVSAAQSFFGRILWAYDYNVATWTEVESGVWRPALTRDVHEVVYWTTIHDCHTVYYPSARAFKVDEEKIGRYNRIISGPILNREGGQTKGLTFRLPGTAVAYVEVKIETKPVN